jgi:hypothetical protein
MVFLTNTRVVPCDRSHPSTSSTLYPLLVYPPFVILSLPHTLKVWVYKPCSWKIILLTYLLTHSMVQDILWKADNHSACQTVVFFLYGTRRFITVSTKARHWTLSWASRIQFAPSIPISLRSILMLSSYLRLSLPSGILPSDLPTKIL